VKQVDFYFDFGSPAAYLAYTQIGKIASDAGAVVNWRPMLLGGVFQATDNRSPASVPAKGKYMFKDLERYAKRYGVPFEFNPFFMINTLPLMRAAAGLQLRDDPRFPVFVDAMFKAVWVNQLNMNDPAVIGQALHAAGFDAAAMLALSSQQDVKDQLKALTEEAVARGVFGAPTMFVGQEMFWGQDRLEFVSEALRA
jgi:2-hydroxychromene-2-carboxylate isomerase